MKAVSASIFSLLLLQYGGLSSEKSLQKGVPPRVSGIPSSTLININRISAWYQDDVVQEFNSEPRGALGSSIHVVPRRQCIIH